MSLQKAILPAIGPSGDPAPSSVSVERSGAAEPAAAPTPQQAYLFHASANLLFGVLNDAGERFGQDYTAFVVYRAFLVAAAADTLRDLSTRTPRRGYAPGALSAHSVAAMTGIPRETVRRKCLKLAEQGLIERQSEGRFCCRVGEAEAAALVRRFRPIQLFTPA